MNWTYEDARDDMERRTLIHGEDRCVDCRDARLRTSTELETGYCSACAADHRAMWALKLAAARERHEDDVALGRGVLL